MLLLRWSTHFFCFLLFTPFCLLLSLQRPFRGPSEWFEFVYFELRYGVKHRYDVRNLSLRRQRLHA